MTGDLIIKGVDLEQLEEDLNCLEEVYEDFLRYDSRYKEYIDRAGTRVLGMLKTWAEGRKAEKEDVELAESLTTNLMLNNTGKPIGIRDAVLYALKEQRKRLGK